MVGGHVRKDILYANPVFGKQPVGFPVREKNVHCVGELLGKRLKTYCVV